LLFSIIIFIISSWFGIPADAPAPPAELVAVLVLVPGGSTGLGAVLGVPFGSWAHIADTNVATAIPTKTLIK
jgi:hypothetical protein